MKTCLCLYELKGWFILYSQLINHKSIKQKTLKVSLEKQISKYSDFTNKEYLIIKSYFKNKMLKKGEILHSTNTICDKYYFIETGLIRYFIINNGEEITGGFFLREKGTPIQIVLSRIVFLDRLRRSSKVLRYFLYLEQI